MSILDQIFRRNRTFMCKECGRGYPYKKGETALVFWYGTFCRSCGFDKILNDTNERLGWRGYINEIGKYFHQKFIVLRDPNVLRLEVRHEKKTYAHVIDIEKMIAREKREQREIIKRFYLTMLEIPKLSIKRGRAPSPQYM